MLTVPHGALVCVAAPYLVAVTWIAVACSQPLPVGFVGVSFGAGLWLLWRDVHNRNRS